MLGNGDNEQEKEEILLRKIYTFFKIFLNILWILDRSEAATNIAIGIDARLDDIDAFKLNFFWATKGAARKYLFSSKYCMQH